MAKTPTIRFIPFPRTNRLLSMAAAACIKMYDVSRPTHYSHNEMREETMILFDDASDEFKTVLVFEDYLIPRFIEDIEHYKKKFSSNEPVEWEIMSSDLIKDGNDYIVARNDY